MEMMHLYTKNAVTDSTVNILPPMEHSLETLYKYFIYLGNNNMLKYNKLESPIIYLKEFKDVNEGSKKDNLYRLFGLVIDIDGGDIKETLDYLYLLNLNFICHTTHSHKPDYHKFHIFMMFDKPITPDEFEYMKPSLKMIFNDKTIKGFDDSCFKNVQSMFLPPPYAKIWFKLDGDNLIVDKYLYNAALAARNAKLFGERKVSTKPPRTKTNDNWGVLIKHKYDKENETWLDGSDAKSPDEMRNWIINYFNKYCCDKGTRHNNLASLIKKFKSEGMSFYEIQAIVQSITPHQIEWNKLNNLK